MPEPVSQCLLMVLALRGYEVAVTTNGDTVRVTCPELPQLSVSDASLDSALALAEDAIAAILGRADLARRPSASRRGPVIADKTVFVVNSNRPDQPKRFSQCMRLFRTR